jgi:hypothetical protein
MSGGNFVGIFHSAEQLKADCPPALPANGKPVAGQQRSFMHQAMRAVGDAVDAAFWNQLPGPMLLFQNLLPLVRPKSEHAILKTSNLAGKAAIDIPIHDLPDPGTGSGWKLSISGTQALKLSIFAIPDL